MAGQVTEQIFFSGIVQGVGFRQSTQRLAKDSLVTGYVLNLADGRVEMVATAEPAAIKRLIDRLRGLYGDAITDIERIPHAEPEKFSDFTIRRT